MDFPRPTTLTSNICVLVSLSEASSIVTPLLDVTARIAVILWGRLSAVLAPRVLLPSSGGGQLRPSYSTVHPSNHRTLVSLRLRLRPPLMPSPQTSIDDSIFPVAAVSLPVRVSPTPPILVPSGDSLPADVTDLSFPSEPQPSSVAVPASASVPSKSLFLSSSSVVLSISRFRLNVVLPFKVSVHDWKWPPGWETYLDNPYREEHRLEWLIFWLLLLNVSAVCWPVTHFLI